ncbi:GNAT family N-acetyltransferase [Methanobacterium oryzae]|uniref:GNAT family N-acetyltransferase n=1 Tax=Methanobacterium oryzae TaxID=69540 RepID=UPI003D1F7771
MPIKTVKDHFHDHFSGNLISRHLNYYFLNSNENKSELIDQELELRTFNIGDIDKCAKLFKEVFSDYPWYDNWISFNQVRNYLIELIENPVFEGFLAYDDKEIVAVCLGHKRSWWMGKEFCIDEFYVANKMQGNGIGTKLMDYVKDSLIKEDYTRLVLLTNKEIPAEEFYIKNGFYTNQDRINMINEL